MVPYPAQAHRSDWKTIERLATAAALSASFVKVFGRPWAEQRRNCDGYGGLDDALAHVDDCNRETVERKAERVIAEGGVALLDAIQQNDEAYLKTHAPETRSATERRYYAGASDEDIICTPMFGEHWSVLYDRAVKRVIALYPEL